MPNFVQALAFDPNGRLLAGWPIRVGDSDGYFAGRVIGDALTLFARRSGATAIGWLTTVAADGSIQRGRSAPLTCCAGVAIGLPGVAYGTELLSGLVEGSPEVSQITAIDLSGARADWPVEIDGIASGVAVGPRGQTVVTVGSSLRRTSRVAYIGQLGEGVVGTSAELPIVTAVIAFSDGTYECGMPMPDPPLVAEDGTIFLMGGIDTALYAFDVSLEVKPGWPYRPATPLVYRADPRGDLGCGSLALPAVGPDSTLYLGLQARDATVGGTLVAVDRFGTGRPGWPVELRRPGAEFWSVVVGWDGTVYALAVEREAGATSSASILAIAPDSTVLYTTTIIDP